MVVTSLMSLMAVALNNLTSISPVVMEGIQNSGAQVSGSCTKEIQNWSRGAEDLPRAAEKATEFQQVCESTPVLGGLFSAFDTRLHPSDPPYRTGLESTLCNKHLK